MSRENPRVFQLKHKDLEKKRVIELKNLLIDGRYKEVIKETESARKIFPDNFFFYTIGSIALSETGKLGEAKKLLLKAVKKFPDEYEVHYQLASLYEDFKEYDNAEEAYKKSYELTPEDYHEERSDCLNNLGVLWWNQNRKEEALEQWKLAIKENPNNINAQDNYENFSNEFGEPVSVSGIMDDLHHFQDIQIDKYFQDQNIVNFRTLKEAKRILNSIQNTWNIEIAPNGSKLDELSAIEKTEWFKNIGIDFNKSPESFDKTEFDFPEERVGDELEELDELFPYLPPGSALLLPIASFALKAIGYKEKRISEILQGAEVSEAEEYFITWAIDIVGAIVDALLETRKEVEEDLLAEALDIALEELDKEDAIEIIAMITEIIYEFFDKEQKKKQRAKRRLLGIRKNISENVFNTL